MQKKSFATNFPTLNKRVHNLISANQQDNFEPAPSIDPSEQAEQPSLIDLKDSIKYLIKQQLDEEQSKQQEDEPLDISDPINNDNIDEQIQEYLQSELSKVSWKHTRFML